MVTGDECFSWRSAANVIGNTENIKKEVSSNFEHIPFFHKRGLRVFICVKPPGCLSIRAVLRRCAPSKGKVIARRLIL